MARKTLSQKRAELREQLRAEKQDYRLVKSDFNEALKRFNAASREALRSEKRIEKIQEKLAALA